MKKFIVFILCLLCVSGIYVSMKSERIRENITEIYDVIIGETKGEEENNYLENANIIDINLWQTGYYNAKSLEYKCNTSYFCCKKPYIFLNGNTFTIKAPEDIQVIVREADKNYNIVKSVTIVNNEAYTPEESTEYLYINIRSKYLVNRNAEYYINMINSGKIKIIPEIKYHDIFTNNIVRETMQFGSVDMSEVNYREINDWQTGDYKNKSLRHITKSNIICLKKFSQVNPEKIYNISLPENIMYIIREINEVGQQIKTFSFTGQGIYKPNENARYVTITLFEMSGNYSLEDYEVLLDLGEINVSESQG